MEKFYHFILLFFLIFNFRVPIFHNSMILALFLSLPVLVFCKNHLNTFIKLLKTKFFFRLLSVSILIILWFFLFARLRGVDDYSFPLRLIILLIGIIVAMVVLSITYKRQLEETNYILKLLFTIFLVQALIQLVGFANHDFFKFIQIFHNQDDARAVSEIIKFGGLRGGALAGDLFFTLSVSYGLIFFLYIKYIIDKEYLTVIDSITLLLYLIGMFTSARIGYLGVLFAIIYFITVKKIYFRSKIKSLFKFIFYIILLLGTLYIVTPSAIMDTIINTLLPFAFEFIYHYIEDGQFSTASTNHLAKDMFVYPSTVSTWIWGDGRMVGIDGSYYMHTDAGYSRILFYSGLYGLLMLFLYQLLFFPYRNIVDKDNFFKKNYLKTLILIILYICLINIKGLALVTTLPINLIIIFSFFDIKYIFNKKKRTINGKN